MRSSRYVVRLLGLFVMVVAVLATSLLFGAADLNLDELLTVFGGGGDEVKRVILLHLRLPRVVLAALVGGALALSGAVFQALLRNPLATPYILGVSGGAAVGAVLALGFGFAVTSRLAVPVFAFAGAVGAITLVLGIAARAGRGLDARVLLLTGVVVGAFFQAIIMLLINFADVEMFRAAILWTMGSFAGASWRAATTLALYLVPALAILLALARPLNLLSTGEQTAFHLGIRVQRVKLTAYLVTSLTVAAGVAVSGAIGFVGLVVPHAIRLVWGSDHRFLLPASFLTGAAFLVMADTVARTIVAPTELPVGVVTALVGVPIFIVLLVKSMS